MRSISHWGMFESFDKEVRVAYSPEYLRQLQEAQAAAATSGVALGLIYGHDPLRQANACNAIYQANNFGKLD